MTPEIALTLGIVAVAVVLFAAEILRVDLVALLVLLTLALTGLVAPGEVFAGFANPAVVTVWAVYIVSGALFKTGVADFLGGRIVRLAGTSEPRLIAVIMLTCGLMSAFMNNIGATAILLPAVAGISRQTKVPLSRLLIPLSFSSLLGGNMTLIGTPPNVLAASLLADTGLRSFNFFDFFPTGAMVFIAGILYMVIAGRHLLPARPPAEEVQARALREYVSEVRVLPHSKLVGNTLGESDLGADYDLTVLTVLHDEEAPIVVYPHVPLRAGDLLLVEGTIDRLIGASQELGLEIEPQRKWELDQLDSAQVHVVEATLSPRSRIAGRTLRELDFRDRYGFTALAISRHGEVITRRLRDARLQFGDALLLLGPRDRLPALQEGGDFLVLEPVKLEPRRQRKAPLAIGAMGLVLVLTTLFGLPIATAMVIGAVVVVLGGALTMDEAYQSIEWRSIFLIAGMLPLGTAMQSTGTANYLSDLIVGWLGALGPLAILAGIYLLASLVTEPMSNAAATVLMVPIAIDVALGLGANPQPFVLATVIGASTSFLTPIGHQVNVLVYGAGGYRFFDFARVGAPLNLLLMAVTLIGLPLIWPL